MGDHWVRGLVAGLLAIGAAGVGVAGFELGERHGSRSVVETWRCDGDLAELRSRARMLVARQAGLPEETVLPDRWAGRVWGDVDVRVPGQDAPVEVDFECDQKSGRWVVRAA